MFVPFIVQFDLKEIYIAINLFFLHFLTYVDSVRELTKKKVLFYDINYTFLTQVLLSKPTLMYCQPHLFPQTPVKD